MIMPDLTSMSDFLRYTFLLSFSIVGWLVAFFFVCFLVESLIRYLIKRFKK